MSKHTELGRKGEEVACDFLKNQGHFILATNLHIQHKEIDIISQLGNLVIFTEVKTRSSLNFGFPEEAVTMSKQAHLKEAANQYLAAHEGQFQECRFDIISIVFNNGKVKEIKHFKDAFY